MYESLYLIPPFVQNKQTKYTKYICVIHKQTMYFVIVHNDDVILLNYELSTQTLTYILVSVMAKTQTPSIYDR